MAANELIAKLNELVELRQMASDLGAEIEAIQDEIKSHMAAARANTLTAGAYKVVWKEITATRIDTAALRHDLPEIWQEYGKTTTTRRFTISAR